MHKPRKTDFVGKTIKSIDTECVNVLRIYFTDGTATSVWSELGGPIVMPRILVERHRNGLTPR